MSNRLFQSIIHQMSGSLGRTVGIIDESGIVIACSDLKKIGEVRQNVRDELSYTTGPVYHSGAFYRPIGTENNWEYVTFVEGEDEVAEQISAVLTVTLTNIKNMYDEKYDRNSFIKNIILDNILPNDIYIKSKELQFSLDATRAVFLLHFEEYNDLHPLEILTKLYEEKKNNFVLGISQNDVALVCALAGKNANSHKIEINEIAENLLDTLTSEFFLNAVIGIGTPVSNIKDLAKSYKEAQIAIEVGKIFSSEKRIVNYSNLGIGRLIYQLPTTLCEMYLSEVFCNGSLETLDLETLQTIQAFFENNLNISEAARKMFIHRNTLVYRLDKIYKLTGLDIRNFDNAITFQVALMVDKYLKNKPIKY